MFHDRTEAGALLAARLEPYRATRPLVLGLTRGGVPVAAEVARALRVPLDIVVVRKLGTPGFPELAMGAIAEGDGTYLNAEVLRELGLDDEDVAAAAAQEATELARRVREYRGDRGLPDVRGRTVIIVDDGVATGSTAHAAARAVRRRGAARVVLAAPVVAAESEPALRSDFDEVVALAQPSPFFAVGAWYERFDQVSDAEVVSLLRAARPAVAEGERGAPAAAPDPPGSPNPVEEEILAIPFDGGALDARLCVPADARGLVLFVHGTGSSRHSPRNRFFAATLERAGFATLLFDLLTPEERGGAAAEEVGRELERLADRVVAVTRWAAALPVTRGLRIAYVGASTGATLALSAAAAMPELVAAVVSRGGRPDLVPAATLERVRAPVLLVVGRKDAEVLELNRAGAVHLARAQLAVVPSARHLFEEAGALDGVARLAAGWLAARLAAAGAVQASGVTGPSAAPAPGGG